MFEKEFREWFESNKKWLYSSDHLQAAYFAWCAGIKQQQAAQQSFAPDAACACAEPKPELRYFDVLLCSACKSPRG